MPILLAFVAAMVFSLVASHAKACLTAERIPKFNAHGLVELDDSLIHKRTYEHASAVFIGRVVEVQEIKAKPGSSDEMRVEASVDVIEVLKGELPASRKVMSGTTMCDLPLSVGRDLPFCSSSRRWQLCYLAYGEWLDSRSGESGHSGDILEHSSSSSTSQMKLAP